jgi:hypothetical protein
MTNEQMLENIRKDRPNRIIHEVLDFKENNLGFYDVLVDMQQDGVDLEWMQFPTIRHVKSRIPYPLSEYNKLSMQQQLDYRWKMI